MEDASEMRKQFLNVFTCIKFDKHVAAALCWSR